MRRGLALLALLLLAGCGETIIESPKARDVEPPPRDLPRVPPAFAESLIARRRVDHLKLRVYDTGRITTRGSIVSSIKSPSSTARLPVPVFLIKHPKQGYILFDTGAGAGSNLWSECLQEPVEALPRQDIFSQLRADGVDPAEIKFVILSHLHRDHAGAVSGFSHAQIIVSQAEWFAQKARQMEHNDPRELDPSALEPLLKTRFIDFQGEKPFGAFDHGVDLFGDGTITLVDLSGHSPGTMGAWVNLDSGAALLAGDATWLLDNHQDLAIPQRPFIFDPQKYWRRLYEMRAMSEAVTNLVIYPGHDLDPLRLQPRADVAEIFFAR